MSRHPKAPVLYDSAAVPKVGRVRRAVSWWMGSTKTLMVSGVFMVIVAATGVWLVVFPSNSPPPAASGAMKAATASNPATAVIATPSITPAAGCKEQKAMDVLPETLVLTTYSTQWYPIGAMLAPQSKDAGPLDMKTQQCFARTPEGALYAVATRVALEAQKGGVSGRQFSGYQWLSYTPDLATVSVAARAVSGNNAEPGTARSFSVTWSGNDWQVAVIDQPVEYLDGLRTFTTWGGA